MQVIFNTLTYTVKQPLKSWMINYIPHGTNLVIIYPCRNLFSFLLATESPGNIIASVSQPISLRWPWLSQASRVLLRNKIIYTYISIRYTMYNKGHFSQYSGPRVNAIHLTTTKHIDWTPVINNIIHHQVSVINAFVDEWMSWWCRVMRASHID